MITKIGLSVMVAVLIAAGAGCGKKETGNTAGQAASDLGTATGQAASDLGTATGKAASDVGKAAGKAASDVGKAAGKAASAAREQLASIFATQLQQQQQQAQAIKYDAKKYADPQLDGLLKNLDAKLTAASDKTNQIRTADEGSAKVLEADIQKLLGEAGDLYKQAKDRLATLVKR